VPLLLLGSALWAGRAVAAGETPAQAEVSFADHVGQERVARGIGALAAASDLQVVARRHAQRMAERGEPYHNPDLGSEVEGWSIVAENVGVGPNVDDIHQAFMESPTHRDIILSGDLTELGVGVVSSADGRLWVVEVFRRPEAKAAAAPQPAAPLPRTTVTVPAATQPPVTTTAPPPPVTTTAPPPPPTVATEGHDLSGRNSGSTALGRIVRAPGVAVPAPDAAPREVPTAAWVAAFMLAAVVGFQGKALRDAGLIH